MQFVMVKMSLYIDGGKGLIEHLITDGELTSAEHSVLAKLKGGIEQVDSRGYAN